jgi:ABC-type bacteriocin/lantibiotic exporter with double-glycine peptidase domain
MRTLLIYEHKQILSKRKKKPVRFIIPVVSNGTEEHTSNRMMNTTTIAFDGRQGRLMGILLIQPLCDAAHQFRNIVATSVLRTILELITSKDRRIIYNSLHTYHAIELLGIIWLGLIDLLLEVGDELNKHLQRICTARITKRQC